MKNIQFYLFIASMMLAIFSSELYAQTYYQYKYGSPSYDERTQKGVLHKGSIYMFTESLDRTSFTFNSTLRLVKFDSLMNVDFEKDFQFQGAMKVRSLASITDSSLLGVGTTNDTINMLVSSILLCFKENGDTLWTRTLYKPGENVILDYVTTIEDTLILFGTTGSFQGGNIATNASFVKVNRHTGHVISSSAFQFDTISNYMLGINCVFMPYDSMYYAICSVEDSITLQNSQTLSKFDRNFNCLKSVLISDSTFNNLNLFGNQYSGLLANGEYILTSYTSYTINPLFQRYALLSKLDTALNVIWTKQYGYPFSDYALSDLHYNPSDSTYTGVIYSSIVTLNQQGEPLIQRRLMDTPFTSLITKSILPLTDTTSIFISAYQQLSFQTFDVLIHISRNDGYGCFDFGASLPWQAVQANSIPLTTNTIPLSIQQVSNIQSLNQSAPLVVECITTANKPVNKQVSTVQAAPNPSSGKIRISSSEKPIRQWQLINVNGLRLADNIIEPQNEFILDISTAPAGIYMLVLHFDTKSRMPVILKIVKL